LRKLNAYKKEVYKKVKEKLEELKQDNTVKLNVGRVGRGRFSP